LSFPKSLIGNPPLSVIPEIFNRESTSPSVIPEILNRESRGFSIPWTPDKTIQGQAKNGLKIAGVTKNGGNPEVFALK